MLVLVGSGPGEEKGPSALRLSALPVLSVFRGHIQCLLRGTGGGGPGSTSSDALSAALGLDHPEGRVEFS